MLLFLAGFDNGADWKKIIAKRRDILALWPKEKWLFIWIPWFRTALEAFKCWFGHCALLFSTYLAYCWSKQVCVYRSGC